MKRPLLIIIVIFIIIMLALTAMILMNNSISAQIAKENKEYEIYLGREISGTEVATLIGKVTDHNERNKVQKDEKGIYIDNGENSIRIDIKMVTIEDIFPMEVISGNDIVAFIQNFNYIEFKCADIEYHENTGRVSRIIFEEIAILEELDEPDEMEETE